VKVFKVSARIAPTKEKKILTQVVIVLNFLFSIMYVSPGANVIKLFTVVSYESLQQAVVFASGKPLKQQEPYLL